MPTHTPWGPSQTSKQIARGVMEYTTASHGGIHLSPTRNLKVNPAWRKSEGWYEEDCDWSIVVLTFPELFPTVLPDGSSHDRISAAHSSAKCWLPLEYMEVFNTTVDPKDSFKLRQLNAYADNIDKWVAISAESGGKVPTGKIAVLATLGGARRSYNVAPPKERTFLVDETRYNDPALRTPIGYVVDENIDQAIDPLQ